MKVCGENLRFLEPLAGVVDESLTALPATVCKSFHERYREKTLQPLTRAIRLLPDTTTEEKRQGIAVSLRFAEYCMGFPTGWTDPDTVFTK